MDLLRREEPGETAIGHEPRGRAELPERGAALEAAQEEDREWRAERREQVAVSLERFESGYTSAADFLKRLGATMGVVFGIGVATVILLTCLGGTHLAGAGLLLMGLGLGAGVGLMVLAGLCWLVWSGIQRGCRRWARWQAIDLDAGPEKES